MLRLSPCKRCNVYKLSGQLDAEGICSDCRKREVKQPQEPEQSPVEEPTKRCKACKKEQPLSHYSPDKRTKDGLRSKCKDCE